MRDGDFSEGKDEIGMISGVFGKAISRAYGEQERGRTAVLMRAHELRQFFRGELLAARVEQNQIAACASAIAAARFEECGFILERDAFNFGVLFQAFYIFIGERLDSRILRFADPCDGEFHNLESTKDLTAQIAEVTPRTQRKARTTTI